MLDWNQGYGVGIGKGKTKKKHIIIFQGGMIDPLFFLNKNIYCV